MKINGIDINIDEGSIDDMPNGDFKDIYELFGVETALKLLDIFAGNQINVPVRGFDKKKKKMLWKRLQNKPCTYYDVKKISRELGWSSRTVFNIIRDGGIVIQEEGQLGLFDKNGADNA